MKPYVNGEGYRYFQVSVGGREDRERYTISVHQLIMLAHGPCDNPNCFCDCDDSCPCSGRGACPYKLFSDGLYHVHHGRAGGDVPEPVYDNWANWEDNLQVVLNEDHPQVEAARSSDAGSFDARVVEGAEGD